MNGKSILVVMMVVVMIVDSDECLSLSTVVMIKRFVSFKYPTN